MAAKTYKTNFGTLLLERSGIGEKLVDVVMVVGEVEVPQFDEDELLRQ